MVRADPREEEKSREKEAGNHSIIESLTLIVDLSFRPTSCQELNLACILIQMLELKEEQPTRQLEKINSASGERKKKRIDVLQREVQTNTLG